MLSRLRNRIVDFTYGRGPSSAFPSIFFLKNPKEIKHSIFRQSCSIFYVQLAVNTIGEIDFDTH